MTREHRVSRRVLLGAACVLPLVRHPGLDPGPTRHPGLDPGPTRHPGLDPGPTFFSPPQQGRWIPDQVRNDEQAKPQTVTKWDRALAAYRRAEAAVAAMQGAPDSLFDPCNLSFNRALSRLLRTPAPHLPALAAKLDLLIQHEAWELDFAEPALAALARDARLLASRSS